MWHPSTTPGEHDRMQTTFLAGLWFHTGGAVLQGPSEAVRDDRVWRRANAQAGPAGAADATRQALARAGALVNARVGYANQTS